MHYIAFNMWFGVHVQVSYISVYIYIGRVVEKYIYMCLCIPFFLHTCIYPVCIYKYIYIYTQAKPYMWAQPYTGWDPFFKALAQSSKAVANLKRVSRSQGPTLPAGDEFPAGRAL